MYKLHAPLINNSNEKIQIVKMLFKEVLGYNEQEINQFVNTKFMCDIAINLTLEQAKQIVEPFYDNDIQIYLYDQSNNSPLFWQKDLGIILTKTPPKQHYYDSPIISREHLVNPFTQQEAERQQNIESNRREQLEKLKPPTITCPYCQSTNTSKISNMSKAGSVALFGVFAMGKVSKQWKCNNCKSEF